MPVSSMYTFSTGVPPDAKLSCTTTPRLGNGPLVDVAAAPPPLPVGAVAGGLLDTERNALPPAVVPAPSAVPPLSAPALVAAAGAVLLAGRCASMVSLPPHASRGSTSSAAAARIGGNSPIPVLQIPAPPAAKDVASHPSSAPAAARQLAPSLFSRSRCFLMAPLAPYSYRDAGGCGGAAARLSGRPSGGDVDAEVMDAAGDSMPVAALLSRPAAAAAAAAEGCDPGDVPAPPATVGGGGGAAASTVTAAAATPPASTSAIGPEGASCGASRCARCIRRTGGMSYRVPSPSSSSPSPCWAAPAPPAVPLPAAPEGGGSMLGSRRDDDSCDPPGASSTSSPRASAPAPPLGVGGRRCRPGDTASSRLGGGSARGGVAAVINAAAGGVGSGGGSGIAGAGAGDTTVGAAGQVGVVCTGTAAAAATATAVAAGGVAGTAAAAVVVDGGGGGMGSTKQPQMASSASLGVVSDGGSTPLPF